MKKTLSNIKKPIEAELKIFEKRFRDSLRSNVSLLDRIMYYIVRHKGKQMRPMFVILCAKMCGSVTESTYHAAGMVELLHTATLVHDDVVDDSFERRGVFSINALWKNKIAVLVGDFLLSRGLLLALDNEEYKILQILNKAIKEVSEGELLQIERARKLNLEEDVYFEIIRQKTATLIGAACSVGASSTTEDEDVVRRMYDFGEKIGIAFQIKDDLFDLGKDDVGKPRGIDIKEKKLTLPVIYALNNASRRDRRKIINLIRRHNNNPQKVSEVIEFVHQSGGIEYATKAMYKYREEAFELLKTFPDSPAKESLHDLVVFVTERNK